MTLTEDVMGVNGNGFMITSARKLELLSAKHIPNHTAGQISKRLNKVIKFYGRGGFYYTCYTDRHGVQESCVPVGIDRS